MNIVNLLLKALAPKAKAFESATKNPQKAQERVLFEYLDRNKNTEYGKKHNFAKIKSVKEYQNKVPLNNYDTLTPYIERMAKGEPGILTSDRPVFFSATSGSTGPRKLVPVTGFSNRKKDEVMDIWVYYISRDHPHVTEGKILAIVSPEIDGYTESGIPFGSESGHGYKKLPDIVKCLYALPYEVFEIKDYDARYYAILRLSMEDNITTIGTMTPSTVVLLCHRIEKHKEKIIKDIEEGSLDKNLNIEPAIRSRIEKTLKPNPKRAHELKAIVKEKGELLPRYFWPKLEIIECWKRGTVGLCLKEFPKFFGSVAVRDFGYFSSEARSSIPMSDAGAGGVLAVNTNFYEFVPRDDMNKGYKRFLLADEVREGEEYFIILTTPAGLYRYNIDDVIRVDGFFNKTPVIEFVQKGLNVSSVTGEKLYESQIMEAINRATEKHGLIAEACTASVELSYPPRYIFLAEFSGNPPESTEKEFLRSLDRELALINDIYKEHRESQELASPVLKIVRKGEFERFRMKKVNEGMHDGQFKLPELCKDPDFQKNFIIEKEISLD